MWKANVFSLESLKPFCSLPTPGMPNKTIYWTPVLYLRDLLGNWLVAELGGVCVCVWPATKSKRCIWKSAVVFRPPCGRSKNTPFGVLLFGCLVLWSDFTSGVVDASFSPILFSFLLSKSRITGGWQTDFRKLSGNCTMVFLLFRRSELRAVLSFWIFEASFLLSCLLSTYGKHGLL